ncbi:TonB-dependent receptor domain-containing protein [Sphingomonas sp. M1-B02]|uniref:TonB-dependent receptor domain-containing protein n=1 Tax=Sphingomonas sp. M1-B02 TaxID=3114300 RepID=UPI00223F1FDE|nr:TonB-dependent receptor [Sphingomonas sp. S6-11]UZK65364.1 TonB-dependent receptor [Sphingomonas sp. S6-11]
MMIDYRRTSRALKTSTALSSAALLLAAAPALAQSGTGTNQDPGRSAPASANAPAGPVSMTQSVPEATAQVDPVAQDEGTAEDIVVTGTSIRGVAAVGSPAVQVDRAAIEASGASTLAQAARTLPVVLNIGPDESRTGGGQDAAANSSRISAINLRGLGPEATLLLLNGRRLAPGGILRALADPSVIPTSATERLEVVLDGNSAIYGADAVAGVVNIITRRGFTGAETSARVGYAEGLSEYVFTQNVGKKWTNGELFAAFEYNFRSDLDRADRPFLSNDLRSRGGTDQRSTQALVPNLVVGGVRRPLPSLTGEANRYDAGLVGDFLPEQQRYNLFVSGRYDISPDIEVWAEGFGSKRTVKTDGAPLGGSFSVPATNPFYIRGVAGVAPGANETVEYRLPRAAAQSVSKVTSGQVATGLLWDMFGDWQLDAYTSYAWDTGVSGLNSEQLNNFALAAALADSNPTTALNVFGGPISDEIYSRIIGFRQQRTWTKNKHFEAKIDGPLFDLPGGSVRAALGASYDDGSFRYQEYQSVLSRTNTPSVTNDETNHRSITSTYGELFVPLVGTENNIPLIRRLTLSGAVRYDKYSDFGSTTNPKVAVVWEPVQGFSLRGTYGTSFRAPSLVDTGNLNFLFVGAVPDPRNNNALINQVTYTGSNPNLKPEKAKTLSVGFDFSPSFFDGFNVSANYYRVKYRDRILGIGASLQNEDVFSNFIVRNPSAAFIQDLFNTGFLVSAPIDPSTVGVFIDQRRNNVGSVDQDGLDVDIRYSLPTSVGTFVARVTHSEVFSVKQQTFPGTPVRELVDTFENSLRSRGRASLTWLDEGTSLNFFYNYGGDYVNTAITPNVLARPLETIDVSAGFTLKGARGALDGVRVSVAVQNLLDEAPPVVINGTSGFDGTTASAIGRQLSLTLTKRW